jgi:hypothetical protein
LIYAIGSGLPAAMTASLLPCVTTDSDLIVRVSHPIPASRIVTVILPPGLVPANGEDHLWRTAGLPRKIQRGLQFSKAR